MPVDAVARGAGFGGLDDGPPGGELLVDTGDRVAKSGRRSRSADRGSASGAQHGAAHATRLEDRSRGRHRASSTSASRGSTVVEMSASVQRFHEDALRRLAVDGGLVPSVLQRASSHATPKAAKQPVHGGWDDVAAGRFSPLANSTACSPARSRTELQDTVVRAPWPAPVATSTAASSSFAAIGAMLGLAVEGLSPETAERMVAAELGRLRSLDREVHPPTLRTGPAKVSSRAARPVADPPETKVRGWAAASAAAAARPTRVPLVGTWGGDLVFAPPGSPMGRLPYNLSDLVHDDQSGPGVEDFLRKLKNVGSLGAFTELDFLQRVVHTTLEGPALLWWTTNNEAEPFQTWAAFVAEFREAFLPPNYKALVMGDLERRTQGEAEPLAAFVHANSC